MAKLLPLNLWVRVSHRLVALGQAFGDDGNKVRGKQSDRHLVRPILLPPIRHYKRAALLLLIFCTSLLALIAPGITIISLIEDWPFPICISRLWLGLGLVVVLLLL
jgi:hypothetical protein